jgi:cell division initiation protein
VILLITPLDIQNKEFKKSFKGYNTKSVDEFLDEIIEDYERVYKENIELKDKVNMLADQIRQYSTLEETLKNTLIVAQTTADEITSSARQKSENIIEDAEIQRQRLLNLAREEVRSIKNEYESFKKEIFVFKTRYKSFIEAQLMSIEEFYNDIGKKEMEEQEDILENQPEEDIEQMGDLGA